MELPAGLQLSRRTPEFTERTVPAGLLAAHRVADGVWGRLVVQSGQLAFVFEAPGSMPIDTSNADETACGEVSGSRRVLRAGDHQVIPPGRPHHVELVGPVGFHVEFHRPETTD